MKNHIPCTSFMENGRITVCFFVSRMNEITCEMSPRVSRGLGPKKVRSSARCGVHQDLGFISFLQRFHA